MSNAKPWLTSNKLVDAVKRKILLPTNQNTFQTDDILAFINEELTIGIVPEILSFNEEYFVYVQEIPIEIDRTRYPIPYRAMGMKLRDIAFRDASDNIYEMTRISPDDKSYFQKSVNYNNSIEKFYIEGNDVILAQSPNSLPIGHILISFYLKVNQLVRDNRAATITSFLKQYTIENAFLGVPGDILTIGSTKFKTASTNSGTITGLIADLTKTTITSVGHNLENGSKITISGSTSSPNIDGTYVITKVDEDNFTIPKATVSGSGVGTWTSPNLIVIGGNSSVTASTLSSSISLEGSYTSSVSGSTITISYNDFLTNFSSTNVNAFVTDTTKQGIRFDNIPTTDFNSETGVTDTVFTENVLIDLIQTDGGHQTKSYDVLIPVGGFVSSTDIYFIKSQINTSIAINDYMCLSNECIIPQIPSDLHSTLADKASARILAAVGDTEGLGIISNKLKESEKSQSFLIDNRVEGAPIKINTNHTMLRFQKWTYRRRF